MTFKIMNKYQLGYIIGTSYQLNSFCKILPFTDYKWFVIGKQHRDLCIFRKLPVYIQRLYFPLNPQNLYQHWLLYRNKGMSEANREK